MPQPRTYPTRSEEEPMSGWGYHWSPCNGSSASGRSGGGKRLAALAAACVLVVAVAWRAILTGLEIAGVVVGCVAGLVAAYGLARLALRVYRWRAARALL